MKRVALVVLAIAGCKRGRPELVRRELPGFSIELPSWKVAGQQLDYGHGQITVASPPHVEIVSWSAGSKLTPEELAMDLKALTALPKLGAATMADAFTDSSGAHVDTFRISSDDASILMSQLPCGGRFVLVASFAAADSDKLHQQILSSFRCTPDPKLEPTLASTDVDLVVDLPGWYALSRDENQLMLSDGKSMVMLQPIPKLLGSELMTAVGPILERVFGGAIHAGAVDGDRVPLTGTLEGTSYVGFAKIATCPQTKIFVIALSPTDDQKLDVQKRIDAAHCLAAGQNKQVWPDAPKQ
jgi:hypothetical protein